MLFGGALADTFVFDAQDAGTDRVVGLEPWDQVAVGNVPFADVEARFAALTQNGDDVVLDMGAARLVLTDTGLAQLDPDLFTLL